MTTPSNDYLKIMDIQKDQLAEFKKLLKPVVYQKLETHATALNEQNLDKNKKDPYTVFRGVDMDNYIVNLRSRDPEFYNSL